MRGVETAYTIYSGYYVTISLIAFQLLTGAVHLSDIFLASPKMSRKVLRKLRALASSPRLGNERKRSFRSHYVAD